jgi:HK97 family phage prohead protease
MTTVQETTGQETERAERSVLRRQFSANLTAGEGRTVDVRVVPYGVAAEVSDGGPTYREEWAAGAFDDQLVAGHRLKVLLNFEHQPGIGGVIGKGVALRSEPDGLHGSFEVLPGANGDTALELVNAGILDGVSLEAYAKKSIRTAEGVVRRVKAHLDKVALCRHPAFKDAVILAVREEPEFLVDEALLPVEPDAETIALCRRLGMKLPQRYEEAHPDETGTPADAGTPEDGTRPDTEPDTSEVQE